MNKDWYVQTGRKSKAFDERPKQPNGRIVKQTGQNRAQRRAYYAQLRAYLKAQKKKEKKP